VFLLLLAGAFIGALDLVVFVCALPFLLKTSRRSNRYGKPSLTRFGRRAIGSGLGRMFDFSGRANPVDFWFFAVFAGLFTVLSFGVTAVLMVLNSAAPVWSAGVPLLLLPVLALPSLSMAVRRLHDVNKSGLWLALLFVFGHFILLYWFFQPSQNDDAVVICTFE
jgi:uncharacterized membrane protein YhaH (DUF805 family)